VGTIIFGLSQAPQPSGEKMYALLNWSFLIVAVGLSLTTTRFLDETVANMEWASRRSGIPLPPLIGVLSLATIGFLVLGLRPPPEILQHVTKSLLGHSAGLLVWPALMSVGLATFGSATHAALRAERRKRGK
jgi:hypothetical protein